EHLRICERGLTCCTEEMEHKLSTHSRAEFDKLLHNTISELKEIFETHTHRFDGETHSPRVTRWNLKKANWEKYASLTNTLLGNCLLDMNNDKALDKIITTILACANVCIPKGHIINGKPFWNDKLQTLKEEKDLARDRADSSGLLEDCISLRKKQAILKKEILNAKRAPFIKFLENFDYRKDGPKAFRFISALNGKQMQPCKQPMKVGGKILTSDLDIAKIFLKYYREVSNFRPRRQIRKREINSRVNQKWDRLCSALFSDEEFQRALQKLSRGKSAGPDGILPEFILELGSKAKQTILLFINKTWGGSFPSYWRKADVLPILKPKKDPTDIQSFRLISLTCILSKLYERMIVDRLDYSITWTAAVIFLRNRLASDEVTIRSNKLFA
ncbi:uncharacterized protein TNCV_31981, partial [Trichonephila clavipes]